MAMASKVFGPGFWLWSMSFCTIRQVAGDVGVCSQLHGSQGEGTARDGNGTADTFHLLQLGKHSSELQIPSDCFLLEDHFDVHNGVLVATLRFGPGGNVGPSDVKCIASRKVREIVGSLSITGAMSLTSILLPKLNTVRGSLVFLQLPKLVSEGLHLDALERVNENLVVRKNDALSGLSLGYLREVGRTLEVGSNRKLAKLLFTNLKLVQLHLLITSNPGLKLIVAPTLKQIRYDLIIAGNDQLEDFELPSLEDVGEDLEVYSMDELSSIRLPLLSVVGEDATFAHLTRLHHLELPVLKSIAEDFEVYHCYALQFLSMPSLETVKEDVEIHDLPLCSSVSLPLLQYIGEDLEVYTLGALSELSLPSLKIISEDLILGKVFASSLSMPEVTEVAGSLWIYSMPKLSSVDFPKLAKVGGKEESSHSHPRNCHYGLCDEEEVEEDSFYITNNTRLEHVRMASLVSIRCRYFAIFGNVALRSVRLPNLSRFLAPPWSFNSILPSLLGVFRNEALAFLELGNLREPRSWTLAENGPGCSGPEWASNCSGGTVSVEDAEDAIFATCETYGFEADFMDQFCRQAQCPPDAARNLTCAGCYDAEGCLVLSKAFITVPDPVFGGQAIDGSIVLASGEVQCIKAGVDLTSINGCIEIYWRHTLQSIDLQNLVFARSLTISGGVVLNEIHAPALQEIELDLVIQGNPALADANFPALAQVGGRFSLQGQASLTTLFLPLLNTSGSFFLASSGLELLSCPSFRRTSSQLRMRQLNKISNIDLPLLEDVGEDLMVSFCSSLELLNVPQLLHIQEDLELYVLHRLESISFPGLLDVGEDLEIYTNDALTSIRFPSLKLVGEDIEFFDNTGIFELDDKSFPDLEKVEEDLEIYLCAQLQSVDVPQLLQIDEDLLLFGNPRLQKLKMAKLEDVAAREGGGMLITDNLVLTDFKLPSLRRLGNSTARMGSRDGSRDIRLYTGARRLRGQEARPVLIAHNPELARIDLPQLELLKTGLWIQKNAKLQAVDLRSLKRGVCDQFFVIRWNSVLGQDGVRVPSLEGSSCAPALVNLNCNSPDFCVQTRVRWLHPWSCQHSYANYAPGSGFRHRRSCPDPRFANRWCRRNPTRCTDVFYTWAMENSYDFEENVVQPWVSPSRFAAYYRATRLYH